MTDQPALPALNWMTAADQLTLWYDATHWFPFIEDENGNITGPGHQDPVVSAAAVNAYDAYCKGEQLAPGDEWTADEIGHRWITGDLDNPEHFHVVPEGTESAVPVTTLWGQR